MKNVFFILLFALSTFSYGQKDYTERFTSVRFVIPGLDTENTPSWDEGDTVLLMQGYDKGSLEFSKKGDLLMQQEHSRCGNISFKEGVKLLLSKRRRYKESILGTYKYDVETGILMLKFREHNYTFKIIRTCRHIRNDYGFELLLISSSSILT